jgi:Uma2 family endonuclease
MSLVERRRRPPPPPPPLVDGQRLSQAEFLRRYDATPPGFKAELIGGVVHVPSPVGSDHGISSADLIGWLVSYRARTPGTEVLDNATTAMDELGVPQPDAQLRIKPECGGQTRNAGKVVAGAPELVAEIARSSRSIDLGAKRTDYQRAGVQEYVVVTLDPNEVHWHVRPGPHLVRVRPGRDGLYRSKVFPGLWLDPVALLNQDIAGVLAVLERGVATPEHEAFVARLAGAAARAQRGQ